MTTRPLRVLFAVVVWFSAGVSACGSSAGGEALPGNPQVRILNMADGDSVQGTVDSEGRTRVPIQVEVTGMAPADIQLLANGILMEVQAENRDGEVPFTTELNWSPPNGGGEYDLLVLVMFEDKSVIERPLHVTVTGIPVFTPTPPPLDEAGARRRISELILQDFGASVPLPTVHRFDDPMRPYNSRWIGAAYYRELLYYIDLYDDGHYAWSGGPYSNPAHASLQDFTVLCRPGGDYSMLIVYVDYGNLDVDPQQALADVPVMVDWLNGLYRDFAVGQGYSDSPLHIQAEAAYISSPPESGELLTAEQIQAATGLDPADYDLVAQIDLDADTTYGIKYYPEIFTSGGGLALQGCSSYYPFGSHVNIWSAMIEPDDIQGVLKMVLNHELSHLFGMQDNWPFRSGVLPNGAIIDDWIPYEMFGWTDVDGDGIMEILDPTPYGTNGPLP